VFGLEESVQLLGAPNITRTEKEQLHRTWVGSQKVVASPRIGYHIVPPTRAIFQPASP
jgi:hypothetical protein